MTQTTFIIIIMALLAIVPDLIVFTVLHARDVELKRAIDALDSIKKAYEIMDARTAEQRESIAKLNVEQRGLDESFRAFYAKMASRIRYEEKAPRKPPKDEEEEAGPQVPVEQQQIPFPMFSQPGNGLPIQTQPKRKFGSLP